MILRVERFEFGPKATVGNFMVNGSRFCFCLEDVVREVPGKPVGEWKVAGVTAIPYGTYDVVIVYSQRFQRRMPLLLNVPGFNGIRIHSGNTDADTEGCILLGDTYDPAVNIDFIGQSRVAFDRFFPLLDTALGKNEPCYIQIDHATPVDVGGYIATE